MTERLRAAFTPDHCNYAFLQNQDRHVYLHVIPRYARPREVVGLRFVDAEYPDHYAVLAPTRPVPPAVLEELARRLRPVTPI
jgi:diadenosine tetraphosphate (Ap4A) HIT family hydrolase